MTSEEQLINRYFDAFNRHDLEGVVACFHDEAVLVSPNGKRVVGIAEVRRSYETEFALFHDAHCELRVCTGNSGRGVAESYFTGTKAQQTRVEAIGARDHWAGEHAAGGPVIEPNLSRAVEALRKSAGAAPCT